MERAAKELGGKLEEVQVARSMAEADLAIEKQWRASLQVHVHVEWLLIRTVVENFNMLDVCCMFLYCDRWRFKERRIELWSSPTTTKSTSRSKKYVYHVD